jgi:hypothetical protein
MKGFTKNKTLKRLAALAFLGFLGWGLWTFVNDQLISKAPTIIAPKDPIAETEEEYRQLLEAMREEVRSRPEVQEEMNRVVDNHVFEELSDRAHAKLMEFAMWRDEQMQQRIDELNAERTREEIASRPF